MFVQTNTVSSLFQYVQKKLECDFTQSEIRVIFKSFVCKRLNWTDTDFILKKDYRLSESDLLFVRALTNRVIQGEPYQYVVGETEFFGNSFICTPDALIPRPETEELVSLIVDSFPENQELNIVDLCTGSGCIGISLAKYFSRAKVTLTDVSEEALNLANQNAKRNEVDVKFLSHNLLNDNCFNSFVSNSYDLWISNPPYISRDEILEIDHNVLSHEPHIALFVEHENTLLFYERIAEKARIFLRSGGFLFFEINPKYSFELKEKMKSLGFVNIELMKDLQGKYRMLKAQNA
jgi:release factor glutamine methyltransferase